MAANDSSRCGCDPCGGINDSVVCQMFAQSAARYNDGSSHAAISGLMTQQNLQSMFNVKAQQGLASDASDRLANALAMFGSVNNRVAGINPS